MAEMANATAIALVEMATVQGLQSLAQQPNAPAQAVPAVRRQVVARHAVWALHPNRSPSNVDAERRLPRSLSRKLLENKGSFSYSLRLPERPLQKGCLK